MSQYHIQKPLNQQQQNVNQPTAQVKSEGSRPSNTNERQSNAAKEVCPQGLVSRLRAKLEEDSKMHKNYKSSSPLNRIPAESSSIKSGDETKRREQTNQSTNQENLLESGCEEKRIWNAAIEELIDNEVKYLERLELVVEKYIPLMERTPQENLPSSNFTKKKIFCNIEEIYKFHKNEIFPALQQKTDFKQLANIFEKEQFSTMYCEYIVNVNKNVNWKKIEIDIFSEPMKRILNHSLDLNGYLLDPQQRLGKYSIIMKNIIKSYEAYAKKKQSCTINFATEKINDDEILKSFKDTEDAIKIVLSLVDNSILISNIKYTLFNLMLQGQLLVHHEFNVTQNKKSRLMYCFLFEKMFVFTVKVKHVNEHSENGDSYSYKDYIPMDKLCYLPCPEKKGRKFNIFNLNEHCKNFYLESDVTTCNAWVEKIASLLQKDAEIEKKKFAAK
ncbi:proto-oncogene DBL-like [Arctopsyche grandis]|uniref:proto-oncogene DBL-like n=1 Tax=Arctopsyche grandis TaxID=121162 RepID=UPI00406D943B